MDERPDSTRTGPRGAARLLVGVAFAALGVLGLEGAIHFWLDGGITHSPTATHNESATDDSLTNALAEERKARVDLADRVAALESILSQLLNSGVGTISKSDTDVGGSNTEESGKERLDPHNRTTTPGFDDEGLLAKGIDEIEVARLREIWAQHQLDLASLVNRSLRDGSFSNQQHQEESMQLDRQLRDDLRVDEYDQYLYASGQPNRVGAKEVIDGSPAREAGLRRGDTILRYDETWIFKPRDVLRASARGELGESVALEILRNGQQHTLYIRRGPLGVMMDRRRSDPRIE